MLAESFASNVNWTLIFAGLMTLFTFLMWLDARKNRATVIANQPLNVEIVKELHEEFANKEEFDIFKTHVTTRHGQLFSRIEQVQNQARVDLASEVLRINSSRERTMENLAKELGFIRESIVEVKTELKIRNQT